MEEAKGKKASTKTTKTPKQNHDLKNWGYRWWGKCNPTTWKPYCARFLFFFLDFSNQGLLGAQNKVKYLGFAKHSAGFHPVCVCVYPHHLEIWRCVLTRWAILSEQDHTKPLYLPVNITLQWLQHLLHKKNAVRTYESEHWLSLWTMTLKVGMLYSVILKKQVFEKILQTVVSMLQ